MKILFLGDVVGQSGRNVLSANLATLQKKYDIDFTIVNGENSAHGKGITTKIYNSFKSQKIDVITLGNHSFSKGEIKEHIDECVDLIRPINMSPVDIGRGYITKKCKGLTVCVINLEGQVFMDNVIESPIETLNKLLPTIAADIKIVDIHGEATSEKILLFEVFKKQLNAVLGTHTHVQTADERVKDGCAFICDAGMCGAYDSILGRDIEEVIQCNVNKEKTHFKPAEGPGILCGVVIDIDEKTKRTTSIERIQIRPEAA